MAAISCDVASETAAAERPSHVGAQASRRLQRDMLERTVSAATEPELFQALVDLLGRHARLVAVCYFERTSTGGFAAPLRVPPADTQAAGDRWSRLLPSLCDTACRSGECVLVRHAAPDEVIVVAPVPQRGREPHGLAIVFSGDSSTPRLLLLAQMVVSHMVLWRVLSESRDRESEVCDASALIELVDHVVNASDAQQASGGLASDLRAHLGCQRVLVGLRRRVAGRCHVVAISGVARFDARSEAARTIEAAMDEALLRGEVTCWPPVGDRVRHATLAHKALATREGVREVVSAPLCGGDGTAFGAIVVLDDSPAVALASARFLNAAHTSLAGALQVVRRLDGGTAARWVRAAARSWRTWKGRVLWSGVAVLFGCLWMPWQHTVSSDCRLEPVTRRFVAAPFEGVLEKSLVKPGDLVRAGDVLARMDGREVRWKRSSVIADLNQAKKKRDAAQASRNYAEQQIAQLEMERLDLELQLLDHRADNLEIRSPVDGVIADGDLERAEGAPLTVGQTLFEVGPLAKMIVEIAVPDEEIAFVRVGQEVEVRLDAYPGETFRAVVASLHPRSEIRDNVNVFIAEAALDNAAGRLRPGMKGRAVVAEGRRALGWILFHKPWEYATKRLAW